VNVITGLIKANIPSRISFAVSSQIDSRTILDAGGAEKLLGKGDMLYSPIGLNKPLRIHGCFIDEQEVKKVIEHWKKQGRPEFGISEEHLEESVSAEKKDEDFDDKFLAAAELVITTGIASVSFLQRRLRVGYSRAARLMDMLEEAGVVGSHEGNKPRDILMSMEVFNNSYCS
jgi:S-DNA-T family DNA segregation ATPase FtsK/SpoIIIE